jgi:hypothetical protein
LLNVKKNILTEEYFMTKPITYSLLKTVIQLLFSFSYAFGIKRMLPGNQVVGRKKGQDYLPHH